MATTRIKNRPSDKASLIGFDQDKPGHFQTTSDGAQYGFTEAGQLRRLNKPKSKKERNRERKADRRRP